MSAEGFEMESDINRIVEIAADARKAFKECGLQATIRKLDEIRTIVAGGELSWICQDVNLLCKDLKKDKGQNVAYHIETFIDIVCSRCRKDGGMS